jgi:hypothetical protein
MIIAYPSRTTAATKRRAELTAFGADSFATRPYHVRIVDVQAVAGQRTGCVPACPLLRRPRAPRRGQARRFAREANATPAFARVYASAKRVRITRNASGLGACARFL